MSDIDVEPVEDVGGDEDQPEAGEPAADDRAVTVAAEDLAGPDAPEYVLYGGKGGVGKTTMAAATALASALEGTTTLVVSTDPAHSLSDTFETDVGPRPERIREDAPLYAAEIDPDAAVEDAHAVFGGSGGGIDDGPAAGEEPFGADSPGAVGAAAAGDPLGGIGELFGGDGGPMEALLGGTMPGADEAAAMQQLLQYLDDDRFDRVVIDTAPTGHTLRLLALPEVMDTMVGKIITLRERFKGMMEGVKGMFGGAEEGPGGVEDLREVRERIERLRATLQDPTRTDFRVVMVPEEMSVVESRRLLSQLAEFEIPVGTVVVNKVMENLAEVTSEVDAAEFVQPNLEGCAFCKRRWDVQQDALREAQEVFRGHDVRRVPLFADEVRGERMLRIVAACLE